MALRKVWIGSIGPQLYEDSESYMDDSSILYRAIRTDQPILIGDAEEQNEAVSLGQLDIKEKMLKSRIWFLS